MTYLEAKYVTLTGNMTIGGMNTRNFDALRDQCVLHLHQETGGVFVKRGDDCFFISPVAITSVELHDSPDLGTKADLTNHCLSVVRDDVLYAQQQRLAKYPVMTAAEEDAEKLRLGARNLADEVLAELGQPSVPSPSDPKKRIRAAKKN